MDRRSKPPLDPAAQRLATESLAHTSEARRMIADLAKSRGVPVPKYVSSEDFEELQEEQITANHDIEELKKQALGAGPSLSFYGPFSLKLRTTGIPGGRLTVLVLSLALLTLAIAVAVAIVKRPEVARPKHVDVPAAPAKS